MMRRASDIVYAAIPHKRSAYLVQSPGRAEYLSGEHGETNWYDMRRIEVEVAT
jgi:hypothetical protein